MAKPEVFVWPQVIIPQEAQLAGFLNPIQTLDSAFHLGVVNPTSGVKVPIAVGAYVIGSQQADTAISSSTMHASVALGTSLEADKSLSSSDFSMWGQCSQSASLSSLTTKVMMSAGALALEKAAAFFAERQDLYEVQQECIVEPALCPLQHGSSSSHSDGNPLLISITDSGMLTRSAHNPVHAASSILELLHRCQQQPQHRVHTLTDAAAGGVCRGPSTAARVMQGAVAGLLRTAATEMPAVQISVHSSDRRMPSHMLSSDIGVLESMAAKATGFVERTSHSCGALSKPQLVHSSIRAPQHDLFQLRPQPRGSLANLVPVPFDSSAVQLKAGEVLLQVMAVGLNFRDVLNVLGMYPGDPGPPGADCAGVIMAVGAAQADHASPGFTVGDAAFGIAPGSLGSCVVTSASNLVPMPSHLGFHEAATVPTVMVTGQVALLQAAQVSAGDTVLVHAAAGGVGLAAIQLLHAAGATVIATAGSPQKRAVLHKLGVEHVVSSRHTQFVAEVAQLGGADVVLNSLTSSGLVAASLAVLKTNGRFVEISKRDIWAQQQVAVERPDCTFAYIAVDFLSAACIQSSLRWAAGALTKGTICPLPCICQPIGSAPAAFRQMMQAGHVGKVVLTHPNTGMGSTSSAVGSSVTVTGGLGGLGLLMAKWALHQSALPLSLTLLSRSGRTQANSDFAALLGSGCSVTAQMLDASFQTDAACTGKASQHQSDRSCTRAAAPLTTLLHASGVLQDSMLQGQTPAGLRAALAPKVAGLPAIGSAIGLLPMRHVALFSSVASLLGTAGQANYAAANAGLDAWAAAQQSTGCVAKAIQWGAWSSTGQRCFKTNYCWQKQRCHSHNYSCFSTLPATHVYLLSLDSVSVTQTWCVHDMSRVTYMIHVIARWKLHS